MWRKPRDAQLINNARVCDGENAVTPNPHQQTRTRKGVSRRQLDLGLLIRASAFAYMCCIDALSSAKSTIRNQSRLARDVRFCSEMQVINYIELEYIVTSYQVRG